MQKINDFVAPNGVSTNTSFGATALMIVLYFGGYFDNYLNGSTGLWPL